MWCWRPPLVIPWSHIFLSQTRNGEIPSRTVAEQLLHSVTISATKSQLLSFVLGLSKESQHTERSLYWLMRTLLRCAVVNELSASNGRCRHGLRNCDCSLNGIIQTEGMEQDVCLGCPQHQQHCTSARGHLRRGYPDRTNDLQVFRNYRCMLVLSVFLTFLSDRIIIVWYTL